MTTRRQMLGRSILGGSLALAATAFGRAHAQTAGAQFTQSGLVGKLEGATLSNTLPASFQEAPQLAELVRQGRLPRSPSACRRNPW